METYEMMHKLTGTIVLTAVLLMASGGITQATPADHDSLVAELHGRSANLAVAGYTLEGTAEFSGRMVRLWKNEANGLVHADIVGAQSGDVVFLKSKSSGVGYNHTVVPPDATFVSTPERDGWMQACGQVGGTSGGGPWGGCTWF